MLGFLKRRRRQALRARPFPDAWLAILRRNFPLFEQLTAEDRAELQGHIQVFLAEKRFEGFQGVIITDEIRVTIAAQACLLLLHRETDYYPTMTSIFVYPSSYVAEVIDRAGGVVTERVEERLGEAWHRGPVVISWDDALAGAADVHDGRNVVLHEFAHQLDQEDGAADGAPLLGQRSRYVSWARVLGEAYNELRRDTVQGRRTVLDQYGATNPAEFFAVATESFFEKPAQLKRKHPELYDELKEYYRQDPASWT
jgi:Mlc titration factor MtfA (ptsG expression regulator)